MAAKVGSIPAEHELFIQYFLESDGDVRGSAKKAGFDPTYGYALFNKYKERIIDEMSTRLVMLQMKAINVLDKSMGEDAEKFKQDVRLKAADSVLDRGGLVKKSGVEVSATALPAIMVLPAKKPLDDTKDE